MYDTIKISIVARYTYIHFSDSQQLPNFLIIIIVMLFLKLQSYIIFYHNKNQCITLHKKSNLSSKHIKVSK